MNVNLARVEKSAGLEGDHYSGQSGNRQLTFVLETDLIEIGRLLKADPVHPEKTRRNLLVIGLKPEDLLPGAKCKIGNSAIIEITGFCHPCKRMNETIGPGAEEAMKNRGGYTAKIVEGGLVKTGDPIAVLPR